MNEKDFLEEFRRRRDLRKSVRAEGKVLLNDLLEDFSDDYRERLGCVRGDQLTGFLDGTLTLFQWSRHFLHIRRCRLCRSDASLVHDAMFPERKSLPFWVKIANGWQPLRTVLTTIGLDKVPKTEERRAVRIGFPALGFCFTAVLAMGILIGQFSLLARPGTKNQVALPGAKSSSTADYHVVASNLGSVIHPDRELKALDDARVVLVEYLEHDRNDDLARARLIQICRAEERLQTVEQEKLNLKKLIQSERDTLKDNPALQTFSDKPLP